MKRDIHSSRFKNLDNLIGDSTKGELVLIGGRPIVDVTQLLINLAIEFSKNASVFYFTSNHLQSGIINRITSSLSQIPMNKFVRNDLTTNDIETIEALRSSSAFNRIHLHDCHTDSLGVLKALRQMFIEKCKLELIIVNNLQDLCHSTTRSKFLKELKSISEDFGVTVVVATEISKAVDTRSHKEPKLKDLPKNNLILELPDKIILVHRPKRDCNEVELIIVKSSKMEEITS